MDGPRRPKELVGVHWATKASVPGGGKDIADLTVGYRKHAVFGSDTISSDIIPQLHTQPRWKIHSRSYSTLSLARRLLRLTRIEKSGPGTS